MIHASHYPHPDPNRLRNTPRANQHQRPSGKTQHPLHPIDDLVPTLGDTTAITPNIDALAASLLPEETGVISFKPIRDLLPDVIPPNTSNKTAKKPHAVENSTTTAPSPTPPNQKTMTANSPTEPTSTIQHLGPSHAKNHQPTSTPPANQPGTIPIKQTASTVTTKSSPTA